MHDFMYHPANRVADANGFNRKVSVRRKWSGHEMNNCMSVIRY